MALLQAEEEAAEALEGLSSASLVDANAETDAEDEDEDLDESHQANFDV